MLGRQPAADLCGCTALLDRRAGSAPATAPPAHMLLPMNAIVWGQYLPIRTAEL
jgi:hypothetical protein